jgi:hypothetical protein
MARQALRVPLPVLGDHASGEFAALIAGDEWRWPTPQKGHSIEAVSPNPRNSPETKLNLSSPKQTGMSVMTIVAAFLVCCSVTVFLAHTVDAFQAR